jgi:hypothetical protein
MDNSKLSNMQFSSFCEILENTFSVIDPAILLKAVNASYGKRVPLQKILSNDIIE